MSAHTGIAIAADFTAEPIRDCLAFWSRECGWDNEVQFAPYDQVLQTLVNPASVFGGNRGVNVILLREHRLTADFAEQFRDAVRVYRGNGGGALLLVLCPSQGAAAVTPVDDALYTLRAEEIARLYPVADVFDAHAEQLGDIPYTPLYFAALGTAVARRIHALRMRPYKVIALDCDNTLWRGTCGEDGPEGVVMDEPRRYLQDFMRARRDTGMLLALASKNNREDVVETFRVHAEMPLRMDDFVIDSIDWNSKSAGFARMARTLKLGLDSFVFVDDSPKEIGEVHAAHPEVLGLPLPHEAERIPHFLDHVWAFDQLRVTEEDRARNQSYRQQVERTGVEKAATTLGEFIAQLQVEIHVQPLRDAQVPRVAQLTQRTNQMNTTLLRRTESEVARMVGADPVACLTVDVADRFGSYGLVGAMFLREEAGTLHVDNMLLSCRALGRGVEQRMLRHVGEIAVARGLEFVEIAFVEGPRNQPARQFLDSVGYRLRAEECAALQYRPEAAVELIEETPKVAVASASRTFDYVAIARDLSTPSQILSAIEASQRHQLLEMTPADPPHTEEERQIAHIWADILHIPTPGREVDFFDVGGHSLLAVQLLSRVRQDMGVELPLELVYTGRLTVASMASAVELARADPEEVDRLLAEIDQLSEEELRALLESEQA